MAVDDCLWVRLLKPDSPRIEQNSRPQEKSSAGIRRDVEARDRSVDGDHHDPGEFRGVGVSGVEAVRWGR